MEKSVFDSINLPFGLTWFPSKHEKKYIVVRVADPKDAARPITKYYSLSDINSEQEANEFISDLVSVRDEIGRRLWDDWPDVARARKGGFIDNVPKGVCCVIIKSRSTAYINITCYWQDYTRSKNKKGQYPQSKKTYRLPIESAETKIREVIAKAKKYRERRLLENPKPPRK